MLLNAKHLNLCGLFTFDLLVFCFLYHFLLLFLIYLVIDPECFFQFLPSKLKRKDLKQKTDSKMMSHGKMSF